MDNKTTDQIIQRALLEDDCRHDITSKLMIPAEMSARGHIITRQEAVICGLPIAQRVFQKLNPKISFKVLVRDGKKVKPGTPIATFKGDPRALLAAERTALNFLGYLSGIATRTQTYVQAVRPGKAKVMDTRKTTPGLRELSKYAVRCGGGVNHRPNLSAMVLVKDNHIALRSLKIGTSLSEAIQHAKTNTRVKIEVEVDTLTQLKEVLPAGPDFILLDNMSPRVLKQAVQYVRASTQKKKPQLEASGGITLKNIRAIALTGVDRISVGALTHSVQNIDISMEILG